MRSREGQGSYELGERIGVGGMAEIFVATSVERHFDRPIVIKRMLDHLAGDRSFRDMFVDEARLSTRLEHPNVVRVFDFEASEAGLFLVMEYIDGPDLLAVLSRCAKQNLRMPPELATYIACHTLEALDYAHGAAAGGRPLHIVHRDVSPSNIIIDRRGQVKLADFGIARAAERQQETATGTLKGKYGYMSPEQIAGSPLDGRSDTFSLAIVLAEMLTGRRLFTATNDLELLLMVRRADLSRLDRFGSHIPAALDQILRKALSPDREHRHASAAEFRDALNDWLASLDRRVGATKVAALLATLESEGGPLCRVATAAGARSTATPTLSGPETRISREETSRVRQVGRQVFALGNAAPLEIAARPLGEDPSLAPFEAPGASQTVASRPGQDGVARFSEVVRLERGTLGATPAIDLWCEIARHRHTGLLTLSSRERVAEIYFRDGHPHFVRSNVPSHRFGEFLLRRGVLTQSQLTRSIATLPLFGGRMGQTLVELGLVRPVDAVRLLSDQVLFKIGECFAWPATYEFTRGRTNPWPALELNLNLFAIMSRAIPLIPHELVRGWLEAVPAIMLRGSVKIPDALALPGAIKLSLGRLSTQRSLKEELGATAPGHAQLELARTAYVLWRCGLLPDCRHG